MSDYDRLSARWDERTERRLRETEALANERPHLLLDHLVDIAKRLAQEDPSATGRLPQGGEWVRCPFCGDARDGHDLECPVVLARMWLGVRPEVDGGDSP